MKRIIAPLAVCALLFAACQNNLKTAFYTDDFSLPLHELRQDSLEVKINVEYPVGDDAVTFALRKNLCDFLFDYGWDTEEGNVDSVALCYRNSLVDEYLNEFLQSAADTTDQRIMTWERFVDGRFLPDWKGYYRYEAEFYDYSAGAHGQSACVYFVFDKKDGSLVEENEFFKEGYEAPVSELIRKHLMSDYVAQLRADGFDVDELMSQSLSPASAWVNGVFLPGPNGVSWVFQPYEIAPYSYGIITVEVPWKELKPWVK